MLMYMMRVVSPDLRIICAKLGHPRRRNAMIEGAVLNSLECFCGDEKDIIRGQKVKQ